MNQTEQLILPLVLVSVSLISVTCCVALWLRFLRAPGSSRPPWLLCALALFVAPVSLILLEFSSASAFNGNLLSLIWLLGIVAGLIALLMRLPRLVIGVMAGFSTGCLCALIGAFVLAMLD